MSCLTSSKWPPSLTGDDLTWLRLLLLQDGTQWLLPIHGATLAGLFCVLPLMDAEADFAGEGLVTVTTLCGQKYKFASTLLLLV